MQQFNNENMKLKKYLYETAKYVLRSYPVIYPYIKEVEKLYAMSPEVNRTEYDMTAMFMEQLEQMIRKAPQYWLWTHKRWKRTKEEWLRRQQDSTIK